MKVRDLISLLLDCPMDGDAEIEVATAPIGTHPFSLSPMNTGEFQEITSGFTLSTYKAMVHNSSTACAQILSPVGVKRYSTSSCLPNRAREHWKRPSKRIGGNYAV